MTINRDSYTTKRELLEAGDGFHARLDGHLGPTTSFDLWARDHWHEIAAALRDGPQGEASKAQESLRDKILAERDKGNLVYAHIEGYSVVSVEDFVKQPVDGMLYDLNRGEETSLSFITEKKWINDFAVALTIRKLVEQRDAALTATGESR